MHAIKTSIGWKAKELSVLAESDGFSCRVPYNLSLSPIENHQSACEEAIRQLQWKHLGCMVGGKYNESFYWVLTHEGSPKAWNSF